MKRFCLFIFGLLVTTALMAQNWAVSGVVRDAETGEPLVGATIIEVGTSNGTVTDVDGNFSLKLTKQATQVRFSYLGYTDQTLQAKAGQSMTVRLKPLAHELGETVVIGYSGTIIRSKLTNSISKVKNESLTTGMFSNPAQALSGTVAGLRVIQNSGDPNASPTIVLRGGTDYNGSGTPLIVVDGMIRGSMNDINPNDIESMEVMKDAGATAIYGSRANNGVILITTKKGKSGEGKINFNSKLSWNHFNNPYKFCDSRDYLYYERRSYLYAQQKGTANLNSLSGNQPYGTGNDYNADGNKSSAGLWGVYLKENLSEDLYNKLLGEGWETMIDPVTGKELVFINNHMEDFNIKTPSFSQDYNLSYSGGNDSGHYYAGLGYNRSEGNAINNFNRRLSALLNVDYKIKPWMTSLSNFNFSTTKYRGISPFTGEANYFSRNFSYPPTFRAYNANGELLLGKNSGDGNQQFLASAWDNDYSRQKFTFSQDFRITPIKDLTIDFKGDWFYEYYTYESFYHTYLSSPGRYNTAHNSYAQHERQLTQTYNILLNYNKSFGNHSLSALAGWEYFHQKYLEIEASGHNPNNNYFKDLQYTITDEGARSIDSDHAKFITESYFARLNYDYEAKYLASFTLRRDGISKLSKDNRWGTFPGMSLGWVFTKEDFMSRLPWLSFGKLRASFGRNGNVNKDWVGNYTIQGAYGQSIYNGDLAFSLSSLPNYYLTWETSRTFELGLDLGFLDNKIQANFTWYDRRTSNKYANITVPASSGWTSHTSNNGTLQNRGVELELNYHVLNTGDWRVDLGFNIASNMNKILKLPTNGREKNRQGGFEVYTGNGTEKKWVGGWAEGERPGDLYVFQAEGIYKSYDEIPGNLLDKTTSENGGSNKILYGPTAYKNEGKANGGLAIMPGDVKWKDVNGDGVIDNYDMVKVGNTTPKWTGGFNLSASWKGLTLSARLDYALGFKTYDSRTSWIMGNMQGTYNTLTNVKDTWSPENPNAKYPIYIWADQLNARNYDRTSSIFAYNGDYLSFRELTLSYDLPKSLLTPLRIEAMRLSVTGQNLGYLCEAPYFYSPEVSNNNGGYPLPRMLVLGLNVTF
ncbi:SusC/RagA family TonB-linked outer membrane protein [Hoylesella enoeca]|uniref:SusC/RagA family TonB-linked outer membrane protein n=1 Tax=Hoylesella enoeca TaxID=76123 RepID=A0A0S2KHM1_9BACT|nr:TonB-dependent receptor [Hoylesella enoeca]ALO47701.1 SusC/RagA family TonB-linked outer membrane protein [Hoylesella enoeca]